jgi:pyridoxine 4-dehydrogenase
MPDQIPGGTVTLAGDLTISRMGFGAMQLPGPGVLGPPKDHDQAIQVLRAAVEWGVTHIDTADFYGPVVANELIKEALHPYPDGLHIVTKVGARRDAAGTWISNLGPEDLRAQVEENLQHLGMDTLDVVNLRMPEGDRVPADGGRRLLEEGFALLAKLQQEGLIRHLGVSAVTAGQLADAQAIAPVVTVQNLYNVANRADDELVDLCAAQGIAYAPFFPLGGFTPLQSQTLTDVASRLETTSHQVALAWLLHRSPAIVLIPGTSSLAHLRDNLTAASLDLPADALAELDGIAS